VGLYKEVQKGPSPGKRCELNQSMQYRLESVDPTYFPLENRSMRLYSIRTIQGRVPFESMLANDFSR
jgi:hypothetical protein